MSSVTTGIAPAEQGVFQREVENIITLVTLYMLDKHPDLFRDEDDALEKLAPVIEAVICSRLVLGACYVTDMEVWLVNAGDVWKTADSAQVYARVIHLVEQAYTEVRAMRMRMEARAEKVRAHQRQHEAILAKPFVGSVA